MITAGNEVFISDQHTLYIPLYWRLGTLEALTGVHGGEIRDASGESLSAYMRFGSGGIEKP